MKRIFIIVTMALFGVALPGHAQFLKKLNKTLEKIESKVDKVLEKPAEGVVKGGVAVGKKVFSEDEKKNGESKTSTTTGKSGGGSYDVEKEKAAAERKKKEELQNKEPFKFDGTVFLDDTDKVRDVTNVHQGIFGIFGSKGYVFYRISGVKFIDGEWLPVGSHAPLMTPQGMIVAKADAKFGDPLYLITPDAIARPLPKEITSATNFVDSLAIAYVNGKYQYIDGDAKVVFPDIHPTPRSVDGRSNSPAPLRDGLRAFLVKDPTGFGEVWGFIDRRGKVVIEPQFREVRSFREGMAIVKDRKGEVYFINTAGLKAFEPQWGKKYMSQISDYDSGICAIEGLTTRYYDQSGYEIAALKSGTRFYNGKAYYTKINEKDNKEYAYEILPGFGDGALMENRELVRTSPDYDACGFAHFGDRVVLNGPGNPDYFFEYSIGGFTADGYAKAYMQANTGNKYYRGFIDTSGNFVLVYYIQDTSVK